MTSTILISGATGATGRAAVETLSRNNQYVRALVRHDDARADNLRELGAQVVVGDLLDIDSVRTAMEGITSAYFVFPIAPELLQATAYFAQAAREARLRSIVNLSQATARRDSGSHAAQNHWVAERIFDWSGIPVTHLRPTLFTDWLAYPFASSAVSDHDVLALPFGTGHFYPVTTQDQGHVIAAILQDPRGHAGQTYRLDGPQRMDGANMAQTLSHVLGRTINYRPVPVAEFQKSATTMPGLGPFFAQHIGAVMNDLQTGLLDSPGLSVEQLTGRAPTSVEDFVRANEEDFVRANERVFFSPGAIPRA